MVNDKVAKFLKGRSDDYRQKCDSWDHKNEQELNKLEIDVKSLKGQRDDVQAKLEDAKKNLKKEQDLEKSRLEKEETQKRDALTKDVKDKEKEAAIRWIQAKLKALHPFKPAKKKGHMKMGKMGKMM